LGKKKKLGLIVNPIAGMGGRVGLKGSDGQETIERAIELGALPTSPGRAVEALKRIASIRDCIQLITYPHEMGEDEARESGFEPLVLGSIERGRTTSADTRSAAEEMFELGVDLIIFAGGDGTARDVYEAVDGKMPVLGIPAGVKIHSAVFAVNPTRAGDLASMYLTGEGTTTREAEVMDVDEQAFRENRISAKLYGYLRVPYEGTMIQGSKEGSSTKEELSLGGIAAEMAEKMRDEYLYIIGPGTTTKPIAEKLGLSKTLLGVDVVNRGVMVASDVNESQLLELIERTKAKVIVTVIGGQGFVFGRGNQQISPRVIRKVGRANIMIVATPEKLASLRGRPLLVDTGDEEVDRMLCGYFKVTTGYGRISVYKVGSR
jgi:predicted polyphosphate/ATP-dependent NAD kinase